MHVIRRRFTPAIAACSALGLALSLGFGSAGPVQATLIVAAPPVSSALPPVSDGSVITPLLKTEIRSYYGSGKWAADTQSVVSQAKLFAKSKVKKLKRKPTKLTKRVVIIDVDDTLLSNYDKLYGSKNTTIPLPAIAPTLKFANWAMRKHLRVVVLTGRADTAAGKTASNLAAVGLTSGYTLRTRVKAEYDLTALDYKTAVRASIEATGQRILVNIGDQYSDLNGGYAARAYLIPNPMYHIS